MSNSDFFENENSVSGEEGSFDLNSLSNRGEHSDGAVVENGKPSKNSHKKITDKKERKAKTVKNVLTVLLICVITCSLLVGVFSVYVFGFVDDTIQEDLNDLVLNFTTTIYVKDKDSGEYAEYQQLHGLENRIWVDYDEMPQYLKDAFVSIEDQRFKDHNGIDWKRTISAFANLFLHFYSSNQGGSTITQQLVKNLTGDDKQSPMRKIREIMRARRLESMYSKDTILECYLNTVCLAGGRYGVEVASNYYFDKTTKDLTLAECAMLASIVKNPESFRPDIYPENNKNRQEVVLGKMLSLKKITQEEYDQAMNEEVEVVGNKSNNVTENVNSYFVDALIDQVAEDLVTECDMDASYAANNVYNGGYKIYCTVDPDIQAAMDSVFTNEKNILTSKTGEKGQSAMTVMDYEGNVLGIEGGLGEKTTNRGLNRATSSPRQPGSTMKPLSAYSQAIESNILTYSTTVNDHKVFYNNNTWTPKNWYGGYWGNITAAYALQRSVNTIPVSIVDEITPEKSFKFLTEKLGITTLNYPEDANLAPLGMGGTNGGLTSLESTAAFAIFGNQGYYYKPTFYTKVVDQRDNVILEKTTTPKVAISEDTATIMNHMLQNVVYGSNGTGAGAGAYVPSMKIYAKTGTSDATNDLWFVGGTPYYVGSCWYGYDSNGTISQGGIAMKIWGQVMSKIHSGLEAKSFTDSKYAVRRYYCTSTGLIATNSCPSVNIGWFKTSDKRACTTHKGTIRSEIKESTSSSSPTSSDTSSEATSSVATSSVATSSVATTSDGAKTSSEVSSETPTSSTVQ